MKRLLLSITVILLLALALTACGGGEPVAQATDTPVPPTNTPVPSTNTPVPPTDTPVPPTDTPVPPTDTPVPPTDTPVPPTPTSEPTEEAAVAASGLPEIPDFPEGKELSSKDMDSATDAAQDVAKSVEMIDFTWKGWLVPPETTWEDADSFYQKFFEEAGWTVEHNLIKENPDGTKMGMVLDESNKTLMITVVGEGPKKDQKALMVIVGQVSDKTALLMAMGMDAMNKQATAEPAATEEPAPVEQPVATEEPAPVEQPTATQAPAQPASPYTPPEGKALFVFHNVSGQDFVVDIGPYSFQLGPGQTKEQVLDPGKYTWSGHSPSGDFYITDGAGNKAFDITVAAGQVFETGVR